MTVSVDALLVKRLEGLAKSEGVSRSSLVEKCLRESLEGQAQMLKVMANPQLRDALLEVFSRPDVVRGVAEAVANPMSEKEHKEFNQALPVAMKTAERVVKRSKKEKKR